MRTKAQQALIDVAYFLLCLPAHIILWPVELFVWLDEETDNIAGPLVSGLSGFLFEMVWLILCAFIIYILAH